MDIQKVLEIFRSDYTEQLYDRKANYIIKLCKERKNGFYYHEVEDVSKIISYAINDLNNGIVIPIY